MTIIPYSKIRKKIVYVPILLALVVGYFLTASLSAAPSCTINATTSNFSTQLAATQPGQTLCLASGNYGTFGGVNKGSPGITITPASGASVSMSIDMRAGSGSSIGWFTLDGITTLRGGEIAGNVHDISVKNSTVTDELNFWQAGGVNNNACSGCSAMKNTNIVLDNNVFNLSSSPDGPGLYEGRISFVGPATQPAGVTVKNSIFENNCADGVQFGGGGMGVTIGPGNEFRNIKQTAASPSQHTGDCGPHVDSIQFVGTSNPGPTITGNYFHDNSTGIASYDGSNQATITNNVFKNIGQDTILAAGYSSTSIIEHNTLVGSELLCGYTHDLTPCRATIRNNIADGITMVDAGGLPLVNDYNLCNSTCPGSHSIRGSVSFVGGASPNTYAGFALATASVGKGVASDGTDIGINTTGGGTTPPTPRTVYAQADLENLLQHYGQTTGMTQAMGDLNADGAVGIFDLGILLNTYEP